MVVYSQGPRPVTQASGEGSRAIALSTETISLLPRPSGGTLSTWTPQDALWWLIFIIHLKKVTDAYCKNIMGYSIHN